VVVSHILISRSSFIKEFDYEVYDTISNNVDLHQQKSGSSYSILVDIDEKSLHALGQWPWSRIILADLLKKLQKYNPAVVGIDILFPEKDRTSPIMMENFYKHYFGLTNTISIPKQIEDNDKIFAEAIAQTRSVLGIYLSEQKYAKRSCDIASDFRAEDLRLRDLHYLMCNTPLLQESARSYGFINAFHDSDGVLRRIFLFESYRDIAIGSFVLALLKEIDPSMHMEADDLVLLDKKIRLDKDGSFLLSYYPQKWYKKVSAIDLLQGKIAKKMLQGKIIIIGSSAIGLHDQLIIPSGEKISGAQVHMSVIDNLLYGHVIRQPQEYRTLATVISIVFTLTLLVLLIKGKDIAMLVTLLFGLLSYGYATLYMLHKGVYISSGYFYLLLLINFMLISIAFFIIDSYRKRLYVEELNRSHVALLDSMVHVAEVHDIETGAHILRTKKYIRLLAQYIYDQPEHPYHSRLSPTIIEMLYRTAPLHDIGKVGIPDSVLKKPGKLNATEYEIMKSHPELGKHIIVNAMKSYEENDFFTMAINIAYTHHEKWDGSGYPRGLEGEEIPLEGRFMAIADVYDALINRRVYKEEFSYAKTYEIMKEGRGTHFDPLLLDAFFEIKEQFREITERYTDESGM